tara:strand:- start:45 stop:647 length:603 start_codon:yes stop_codon:yes gene_type:complete
MKIFFVRHGETDWNKSGFLQGQTDIPLNKKGREQSETLSIKLEKKKINLIFSSPLIRSIETANKVACRFNQGIICSNLLTERHFGILEGEKIEELKKSSRKKKILEKSATANYKPETGESLFEVNQRIFKFLKVLDSLEQRQTILCITHGGVLDLLYRIAINKEIYSPRKWKIPNAKVNIFNYSNKKLIVEKWAGNDILD